MKDVAIFFKLWITFLLCFSSAQEFTHPHRSHKTASKLTLPPSRGKHVIGQNQQRHKVRRDAEADFIRFKSEFNSGGFNNFGGRAKLGQDSSEDNFNKEVEDLSFTNNLPAESFSLESPSLNVRPQIPRASFSSESPSFSQGSQKASFSQESSGSRVNFPQESPSTRFKQDSPRKATFSQELPRTTGFRPDSPRANFKQDSFGQGESSSGFDQDSVSFSRSSSSANFKVDSGSNSFGQESFGAGFRQRPVFQSNTPTIPRPLSSTISSTAVTATTTTTSTLTTTTTSTTETSTITTETTTSTTTTSTSTTTEKSFNQPKFSRFNSNTASFQIKDFNEETIDESEDLENVFEANTLAAVDLDASVSTEAPSTAKTSTTVAQRSSEEPFQIKSSFSFSNNVFGFENLFDDFAIKEEKEIQNDDKISTEEESSENVAESKITTEKFVINDDLLDEIYSTTTAEVPAQIIQSDENVSKESSQINGEFLAFNDKDPSKTAFNTFDQPSKFNGNKFQRFNEPSNSFNAVKEENTEKGIYLTKSMTEQLVESTTSFPTESSSSMESFTPSFQTESSSNTESFTESDDFTTISNIVQYDPSKSETTTTSFSDEQHTESTTIPFASSKLIQSLLPKEDPELAFDEKTVSPTTESDAEPETPRETYFTTQKVDVSTEKPIAITVQEETSTPISSTSTVHTTNGAFEEETTLEGMISTEKIDLGPTTTLEPVSQNYKDISELSTEKPFSTEETTEYQTAKSEDNESTIGSTKLQDTMKTMAQETIIGAIYENFLTERNLLMKNRSLKDYNNIDLSTTNAPESTTQSTSDEDTTIFENLSILNPKHEVEMMKMRLLDEMKMKTNEIPRDAVLIDEIFKLSTTDAAIDSPATTTEHLDIQDTTENGKEDFEQTTEFQTDVVRVTDQGGSEHKSSSKTDVQTTPEPIVEETIKGKVKNNIFKFNFGSRRSPFKKQQGTFQENTANKVIDDTISIDNKEEATSEATQEDVVMEKQDEDESTRLETTTEALKDRFSVEEDAEIINIDSRVEAKAKLTRENLKIHSKSEATRENVVVDSTSETGPRNSIKDRQFEAKQENFIIDSKSEAPQEKFVGDSENEEAKENLIIDGQFEAPQENFIVEEQLDVNLLPEGFFDYSDNRIEVESLLPTRQSNVEKLASAYRNNYKPEIDNRKKTDEKKNVPPARSSRISTAREPQDPIAQILQDIQILNVEEFLPPGYKYGLIPPQLPTVLPNPTYNEFGPEDNINDLLRGKYHEDSKPIRLNPAFEPIDLETHHVEAPSRRRPFIPKLKFGTKRVESKEVDETLKTEANPPIIFADDEPEKEGKEEAPLNIDFSGASLFESILSGNGIDLQEVEIVSTTTAQPSTSSGTSSTVSTAYSTTSTTTTTTTKATTTTPRITTPGVCGEYCRLAGTLVIQAGLVWSETLNYPDTKYFSDNSAKLAFKIRDALENSALVFQSLRSVTVEAFTHREPNILVDFNIELHGLVFDVNTLDLREAIQKSILTEKYNETVITKDDKGNEEATEVERERHLLGGQYQIDTERIDFYVIANAAPIKENIEVEVLDIALPDWAWVVIFGGVISVLIVGLLGCTVGFTRWRRNRVLQHQYLNAKTLADFKSMHSTAADASELEINQSTDIIYKKRNKTDIWTLQRNQQLAAYSRLCAPGTSNTLTNNQKVKEWQATHKSEWNRKSANSEGGKRRTGASASSSDSDSGFGGRKRVVEASWSGEEQEHKKGEHVEPRVHKRSQIVAQAILDEMEEPGNQSRANLLDTTDKLVELDCGNI